MLKPNRNSRGGSTNPGAEERSRQVDLLESIRSQQAPPWLSSFRLYRPLFPVKSTEKSRASHTSHKFHSRGYFLGNLAKTGTPTTCPTWLRKPCGRWTPKLVPRYAAAEKTGTVALEPTYLPARLSLLCAPGSLTWPRSTAPRHPKGVRQLPLLRLQRAVSSMGIAKVRHLHMSVVRGRPSWTGSTHQLRPIHLHGRIQADRD